MFEHMRMVMEVARQAAEIESATGYWPILGARFPAVEIDLDDWDGKEPALVDLAADVELRAAAVHLAWAVARAEATRATLDNDVDIPPSTTHVRESIAAFPVDWIESAHRFQWELDTAASFGDYERVVALLRAWRQKGMPDSFLPIALRMLFMMSSPNLKVDPVLSGAWDPSLAVLVDGWKPGGYYDLYSLVAWADCVQIEQLREKPTLDRPATLNDRVPRTKVRELSHWVAIVQDSIGTGDGLSVAIRAWTAYAMGLLDRRQDDFKLAGKLFEAVPLPDGAEGASSRSGRQLAAAVLAFEDGGAFEDALRAARFWASSGSDGSRLAWRKVAEIAIRQDQLDVAVEALLKAVEDEQGPADWRDPLIIELGLERMQGKNVERALRNAATESPFKVQGQLLAEWLLPWYGELAKESQQRFWHGLYAVSSPQVKENTGQSAWDVAGHCFGEALAMELKAAIFRPFFAEYPGLVIPADAVWPVVKSDHAPLGLVANALQQSVTGNTAIARKLSEWLLRNHPTLVGFLRANRDVLAKATRLRNDATHESLDREGVRALFVAVSAVLAALHPQTTARTRQ